MSFEIRNGDALAVLKSLDSESIQCCVTSPPYFGLRSYGTEPVIWGNHNGCSHEFAESTSKLLSENRNGKGSATPGGGSAEYRAALHGHEAGVTGFCLSCNAWRGELGLEPTFQLYISHLIEIFAEVKRVLKKDGTCFVNLGDSYATHAGGIVADPMRASGLAGTKHQEVARKTSALGQYKKGGALPEKCLMNIPARFAIAMTDELQMIQRNELIWHKPACMPSSATDRWTVDFEPIYFFAKSPKYKFNQQKEKAVLGWNGSTFTNGKTGAATIRPFSDGDRNSESEYRNARTVRTVNFEPQSDEHYASYPTKLIEPFILAGTDEGDTVLDLFCGTGTTLLTALRHRRNALGIELQPKYIAIIILRHQG
jgi:site-specific DNA-methyltransferase (cytosine-N4-specific)